MKTVYFVSGCSGVGKTSVMKEFKNHIPHDCEVHDFDERGVPDNAGHEWRLNETRYWIDFGSERSKEGIKVVIFGFFNPDEMDNLLSNFPDTKVITILLDGEVEIIEKRLRERNERSAVKNDLERAVGGSAEAFILNNTKFVPILREIFKKHNLPIIDTSHIDPKIVAEKVTGLII